MSVPKVACPECGRGIDLAPPITKGDWLACPYCHAADIEVISLDPPMLNWAYEGPEIAGYPRRWRGGTNRRGWWE
jgi:lysine biosynthesis protein LysW